MLTIDDDILLIIHRIWVLKEKASTYAEICDAYKKKYPKTTIRDSSLERRIRNLASKGRLIRANIGGQALFAPLSAKEFQISTWARNELI